MADRALIAISGPAHGARHARAFAALGVFLAGGRSVQVSALSGPLPTQVSGVIIGGGTDVHPSNYGLEPLANRSYDPDRDAYELSLIDHTIKQDLPLLGICRGAQLINTYFGGTLHTSLSDLRQHTASLKSPLPVKRLHVLGNSKLADVLRVETVRINSLHEQGVNLVGQGLNISGRDDDGLVQAIEDPTAQFRLGVQWHPEYLPYQSSQRRIFAQLVATASRCGR